MANVLNRFNLQYIESVDTSQFPPEAWVINPDLSQVDDFDHKLWVIEGDTVRLMISEERNEILVPSVKLVKKQEINDFRQFVFDAGFFFDGHVYETDPQGQANMIATVAFIMTGVPLPSDFTWRTADDISVPHTGQSLLVVFLNVVAWFNTIYTISWEQKKYIDSLEDYDSVVNFFCQTAYPRIVIGHVPKDTEIALELKDGADCSYTTND